MSQLLLIDKLLKDYKIWTIKLNSITNKIENIILQKDQSDLIEEKIISIGISSAFMWIIGGIIGLFATINFVFSVILFIIGLVLSKFVNKKLFGTPRKIEDITDEEQMILRRLKFINNTHIYLRDNINNSTQIVYFKDYIKLKHKFLRMINLLDMYDSTNLAIKYRGKYLITIKKYKKNIKTFDAIFAHKY